jgi:zinc protease
VRIVVRLLGALLLLPALVQAADELRIPPVTRAVFDNGLRVLVAEYHELPLVEFYAIVGSGAAQDPSGKEGLAQLTAATLTRGAGRLGAQALARAIDTLGGKIAAAAGTDGTIVTAEFLSKDFGEGLDLLRQVLLDPTFARDEVRRARDEQEAGIVAALEDTSSVAEKCFAGFLYGTHPYGRPVEGRRSTVRKLGRCDVDHYYERWYRPNNTILVLVGDVRAGDAVIRLREAFGAWRADARAIPGRAPAPDRVRARRVLLVDKPDATQTQIRIGNIAIARNHPDFIPATVANTILGGGFTSRLIEELRVKRSLTYAAWSQFAARLTGGDFRISTFTKSPTTAETLTLALAVEGDFRSKPPTRPELDKAKAYLRGQFPLRLESPDALAGRLAEIEFHGLPDDDLRSFRSRVAAVTPAEVQAVSQRDMPQPDQVAVVVVGKAVEIRAQLRAKLGQIEEMAADACENLSVRSGR